MLDVNFFVEKQRMRMEEYELDRRNDIVTESYDNRSTGSVSYSTELKIKRPREC